MSEEKPSPKKLIGKISKQVGERLRKLAETSRARSEKWKLREKLVRILPADLAKTLPRTFELTAVMEWTGKAFQRQGASFYGKLATVLLSTWFLADVSALIVGNFLPEPPPIRISGRGGDARRIRSIEEYNIIAGRNLFSSSGKIPGEDNGPEIQTPDLGGPPVKTTLPLNLIGTVILRDELRSIATIEDKSASIVYPVRVEDEIPSKAKILKIEPRKVIFINTSSGRREYVELPEDLAVSNPRVTVGKPRGGGGSGAGIERVAPNQFNVARAEIDKALGNLNEVLTQARCVPNFENGLPTGFKCFQIVPGSIYDKLGLQNGDVLLGINGQSINDPAKAFEQLSELKTANQVELMLKRDGRQQSYAYEIR